MPVYVNGFLQFVVERCRHGVFILVMLFAVLAYGVIWWFRPFESLWTTICVTALVTTLPALHFLGPKPQWKSSREFLWALLTVFAIALFLAGDQTNQRYVAISGALLFVAVPYWWVFWRLARRQWFLATGLMIAGALWMVYWTVALLRLESGGFEFLLVPLPFVGLAGILWLGVAYPCLRCARRWRFHSVRGPAWRLAALCMWFAPAGAVGSVGPYVLGLDAIWSAVSSVVVGVVLGVVVSDPLRYLLLKSSGLSLSRDRWTFP